MEFDANDDEIQRPLQFVYEQPIRPIDVVALLKFLFDLMRTAKYGAIADVQMDLFNVMSNILNHFENCGLTKSQISYDATNDRCYLCLNWIQRIFKFLRDGQTGWFEPKTNLLPNGMSNEFD